MCIASRVDQHFDARTPRRQRLVAELHRCGPRPVMEALIQVDAGMPLDDVLERFARIPPATYHAIGADRLAIDEVHLVIGARS